MVLVVNDEHVIADTLAIILRWNGYRCRVAYDALAALKIARRIHPEFILLDAIMPKTWGIDVAPIILIEQPQCRLFFFDSLEQHEKLTELWKRGFSFDRLQIPFEPEVLLERLGDVDFPRCTPPPDGTEEHTRWTLDAIQHIIHSNRPNSRDSRVS